MEQTRSSWQGEYTDGRTAAVHAVVVRFDGQGLSLWPAAGGDRLTVWPLGSLKVDDSYKTQLRITSHAYPDAALIVADANFQEMLISSGALARTVSASKILAALVVLVALAATAIYFGIEPLSRRIARKIPMEYEAKLNGGIMSALTKDACSTPDGEQALSKLLARLKGPEAKGVAFKVVATKDDQVNAFALPGGTIVVTRGFLHAAESPDEVAGVVGHEMEHVLRRHVTARLVRSAILTGIWHFTVGDYSGLLVVDPTTMYQMATLKFDRDDEAEADRGALRMLDRAQIARAGFARFFERLEKEGGPNSAIPAIISTHPAHESRLAMIHKGGGAEHPSPALSQYDWDALRTMCGAPEKKQP